MRFRSLAILLFGVALALPAWAQQPTSSQKPSGDQDSSSSSSSSNQPPGDAGDDSAPRSHAKKTSGKSSPAEDSSSTKVVNPKDPSTWDPYGAYHDIDVGNFYKAKGDPDAAIARYQDAIRLKPDFAKPRLLLAEIYEKRGDDETAIKYFKEYLQVYPDAPDAQKIRKRIEKLSAKK